MPATACGGSGFCLPNIASGRNGITVGLGPDSDAGAAAPGTAVIEPGVLAAPPTGGGAGGVSAPGKGCAEALEASAQTLKATRLAAVPCKFLRTFASSKSELDYCTFDQEKSVT